MVQDVLDRAPLTALLQAFSVQLILLLQQRVQHAFHLPGDDRAVCTHTPPPGSLGPRDRAEPGNQEPSVGGQGLGRPHSSNRALSSSRHQADISDLDGLLVAGTGGLPGRPAGEHTQPLPGSWHPQPGLCRDRLGQAPTLPAGLHSQHQETHLDPLCWEDQATSRTVGRGPASGTHTGFLKTF